MSFITQKGATGPLSLQAGGTFQQATDASLTTLVGTRYDLSDGREVIFVQAGATTISTAGLLCQDAAVVPNHQGLTTVSFTAYSSNGNVPASAVVTLGNTAATANQYAGGYALIDSGPGIGQTLRIASNTAAAGSGTIAVVFEDGPNTALTTSSTVCLWPAHGAGVVVFPTTPTNAPVGVTLYPLTATYCGFLTSKGIAAVASDATPASVGGEVAASTSVAGNTGAASGTGATLIGTAAILGVSGKSRAVFVNL